MKFWRNLCDAFWEAYHRECAKRLPPTPQPPPKPIVEPLSELQHATWHFIFETEMVRGIRRKES